MTDTASQLDAALAAADAGVDAGLARLLELVAIPSISAEAAHAPDVRRAADWLAADLKSMGFDASVRSAERSGSEGFSRARGPCSRRRTAAASDCPSSAATPPSAIVPPSAAT